MGATCLGIATAEHWWLAGLCLVFGGIPTTVLAILTNTLLQRLAPASQRGRIVGLYGSACAFGTVVGQLVAGLVFTRNDTVSGLVLAAVLFAAGAIAAFAWYPPSNLRSDDWQTAVREPHR
jgi:MFS family permease